MAPDGKQTQIANILREGSENTKRLLEMFYFNLLVASWAENKKFDAIWVINLAPIWIQGPG